MERPLNPSMKIYSDPEELSRAVAHYIFNTIYQTLQHQSRFSLVLAGGQTPEALYQILATHYRKRIDWTKLHLFWGDERCVPTDHPESNYKMAYESLISKVPIPDVNIHRMLGEMDSPERAVAHYERQLIQYFHHNLETLPHSFDMVLLGLGNDGHVASLFPSSPVLEENIQWVTAVQAPDYMITKNRITLTLPALNRATQRIFLVSGESKAEIISKILTNNYSCPASYILKPDWFLDAQAASRLS